VLSLSQSLVTFVDGANGALSFIEFRLPSECRILESLVGTLAALGVQILHIQVRTQRNHVDHRLRVAECDGSDVNVPRRVEVQHALLGLVETALDNVRRPLAKSGSTERALGAKGSEARLP
jgi:UTP:GlnB (protein PII) uridylyltransferase